MKEMKYTSREIVKHHSSSRRFKCVCDRRHTWGYWYDEKKRYHADHVMKCACGRTHVRSS